VSAAPQQHIAAEIGISKASVSRILKYRGLSRLSSLELQEPHPRYEREKPGEIIHLDIKKLGRSSVGNNASKKSLRAAEQLRAGNVHSADGWKDVLDPVVQLYRGKVTRIYFRS
jgi:hypothetical protein